MSNPTRLRGILLLAATWLLASAALAAPREYQVFQTDRPPVIDGDAREDIWRAVPWSGDFTGPQGAKADVETQFAMAWDEKFLYVAIRCQEPKPETIHAEIAGRDPRIVNDDHVEILLASSDKPATSPAGKPAAFCRIVLNSGRGRMVQWIEEGRSAGAEPADRSFRFEEAGLDSAARVQAGEWVVEAAIPLPKVQWPLKEGVTCAGNIIRVRPGGAVKEMAWNPAQGDLHAPDDFGAFKLCGHAPKARPIQGGESVRLRNGDRINGSLLRLEDGKIHFSSPTFADEVSLDVAEALRLDLAWTEADAAPIRFLLANGEEINGKIASLSAETVGIESASLGRISFPRALLSRVSFSGALIESHFETAVLKPWETIVGNHEFGNGVLRLYGEMRAGRYQATLALPLHQDKAVTLIAEYGPTAPFTPLRIQLFADRAHPEMQIQNGILLNLFPAPMLVAYKDGQPELQAGSSQRAPLAAEHIRLKVTYNPADGIAKAWCNDNPIAEMTAPDGPKEGEYVVLDAMRPMLIRRLAVYHGIPAPDEAKAGPKPGEVVAYLSNGDTVPASQVEFADGRFVLTTEFGPMQLNPERVVSITFPAAAEKPSQAESAAWVETSGSRFALEVEAITDEFVIGKSPEFGEVKLPRRIVKSIVFAGP